MRATYAERMIQRARELRESDAFAPPAPVEQGVPFADVQKERRFSRARIRQTVVLMLVIVAAVCAMSLCLPFYGVDAVGQAGKIYAPSDVWACYVLWFQMNVLPLFDSSIYSRTGAMLADFEATHDVVYMLVIRRGVVTLVVVACGFMLAVSGLLFQSAFRNPLATPTMLGVSDGVTIGCIIFATLGYTQVSDNIGAYFALVYACGAAAVVAVLFLSRAIGGTKHFNVFDMLLLGTVVCQLLGGITSYITNFGMDITTWQNFYEVQQAGDVLNYPIAWIMVAVVFVAVLVPTLVLRFKFNLISFSDEEARTMGVSPRRLRGMALVLGSLMQLAAIASIGQVAMLSLAVPFLVRYLMPSEFRYQLLGNFLLGVLVLLACMAVQHFCYIGGVVMPVGTVISVLIIPFFVWAVAMGTNRWGD